MNNAKAKTQYERYQKKPDGFRKTVKNQNNRYNGKNNFGEIYQLKKESTDEMSTSPSTSGLEEGEFIEECQAGFTVKVLGVTIVEKSEFDIRLGHHQKYAQAKNLCLPMEESLPYPPTFFDYFN